MTATNHGYTPIRREPTGSPGVFRVIVGSHLGAGPTGCRCDSCSKKLDHVYSSFETFARIAAQAGQMPPGKRHYTGDIIESSVDLVVRLGANKFQRVPPEEATMLLQLRAEQLRGAETPKAARPRATSGGA